MKIKYDKHMKELWKLAGKIGYISEGDTKYPKKYAEVYKKLSEALDKAEEVGLIKYEESNET